MGQSESKIVPSGTLALAAATSFDVFAGIVACLTGMRGGKKVHRRLATLTVLFALMTMMVAVGSALAKTQTTAGMTFMGPDTHFSCVDAKTYDKVNITGVGSNTLKGAIWLSYITDTGAQEFKRYPVDQTGDLNLQIEYPPVSQWPVLTNSVPPGTREIHADVSIDAYDPSGNWLGLFDGLQGGTPLDWDLWCSAYTPPPPPQCKPATSSIDSGFNGTKIGTGSYLWFNSNFKVSGLGKEKSTISFGNSRVAINGTDYAVPKSRITFDPAANCASTKFVDGQWEITVPMSGSDEIFLSGLVLPLATGLPAGAKVTWTGDFAADQPGLSVNWKWSAAVYSSFSTDYNSLNVKPTHTNACGIDNSDHAGTPENFKKSVVGGARGGGGSNFTGSWSGTKSVDLCAS